MRIFTSRAALAQAEADYWKRRATVALTTLRAVYDSTRGTNESK